MQIILLSTNVNLFFQKAAPAEAPKDAQKAKKATKSKYEELPEIPDYEHPDLEKYDKSDFDPTKKVMNQSARSPYYELCFYMIKSPKFFAQLKDLHGRKFSFNDHLIKQRETTKIGVGEQMAHSKLASLPSTAP